VLVYIPLAGELNDKKKPGPENGLVNSFRFHFAVASLFSAQRCLFSGFTLRGNFHRFLYSQLPYALAGPPLMPLIIRAIVIV